MLLFGGLLNTLKLLLQDYATIELWLSTKIQTSDLKKISLYVYI